MYNTVKAFDAILKLFIDQIERSDFSHFENCQMSKNETKPLCSTNRFVEMLKKSETDFSSRVSDVNYMKNYGVYLKIHLILTKMIDTFLQLEVIEL
jgi:uncharacterized protein YdaT